MEIRARYVLIGAFMLAVIVAGFGFVYWLHAFGGLTEKAVYRVRFEGSVAGLLVGGPVLFNGIRVGEVTGLQLNADDPRKVTATIAVESGTPVRADTRVGIESQGLLGGSSAISLAGGDPTSPVVVARKGDPPLLVADAAATRSMTETAREALGRLDAILADNSQALHDTMSNLKVFTDALARNSDRIDGLVTGLEKMVGTPAKPYPGYDIAAPSKFPPLEKTPRGQLVVADPTGVVAFDTQKILVSSSSGERTAMDNAQLSDSIPKLVQAKVIQAFENAGYPRVGRPTDGITGDFQLLIDIRSFQIFKSPDPVGDVELSVKIVGEGGRVVAARVFHAAIPAAKLDPPSAAAALNQAFAKVATDLVTWSTGFV